MGTYEVRGSASKMAVGLCEMRFFVRNVRSLKQKRSVVRRIVERTRARYPISIAEVGDADALSSARVGFSVVGNDMRHLESLTDTIINYASQLTEAELVNVDREVMRWSEVDQEVWPQ